MPITKYNEVVHYTERVNIVLNYIHSHLDAPLSLESYSNLAGFSPYHFHRIFKLIVNETPNKYIQRVRIEKASRLLAFQQHESLTEIGLECGFSSIAGFSRSFRDFHGMSPSDYRLRFNVFQPRPVTFAEERFRRNIQSSSYNNRFDTSDQIINWALNQLSHVQVLHLPPVKVLAVRHLGLTDTHPNVDLSIAFDEAFRQAGRRGLLFPDSEAIGVSYDDPYVTPLELCRYDACTTVIPQAEFNKDFELKTLPGGKYACIPISGDIHMVWLLSGLLAQHWLPRSGYILDDRPFIEKFDNNPLLDPDRRYNMKWYLPIKPKSFFRR